MIRFALVCALVGLIVGATYSGLLGAFWILVGAGVLARATREPQAPPDPAPRPQYASSTSITYTIKSKRSF